MKIVGTYNAPVIGSRSFGVRTNDARPVRTMDAAVQNAGAMLVSELEKLNPLLLQPLNSFTYPRDIPIKVGGGWVEFITQMNVDYGLTGGSGNGPVTAPGANAIPVIQANVGKDKWVAHVFSAIMRIMFVDLQRGNITGRSLEQMLTDGMRLAYDKHMDENVYVGMSAFGTTGLINNPNVAASNVATGAGGTTFFNDKTADEILADTNEIILSGWKAAEYDESAIPNHLLMPHEQYNWIATTKVSPIAEKTILTFLLENNIAKINGSALQIYGVRWLKGAGAGGTDRMVSYVHNDRFIAAEELVPLQRIMTAPNTDAIAYDSVFSANLSEVEIFYTQPISYRDGI